MSDIQEDFQNLLTDSRARVPLRAEATEIAQRAIDLMQKLEITGLTNPVTFHLEGLANVTVKSESYSRRSLMVEFDKP